MTQYQIIDGQTGETVKVCKTLRSASRACDKLNNAYGAVRYSFRRIETPEERAKYLHKMGLSGLLIKESN